MTVARLPQLIAILPGQQPRRRLDMFETEALVNVFGTGQPAPSVCDRNEAQVVLRQLNRQQAILYCQCNTQAPTLPKVSILRDGDTLVLANTGVSHAHNCPFARLEGRRQMRVVDVEKRQAVQVASQRSIAARKGDYLSYLQHNLIALIAPVPAGAINR